MRIAATEEAAIMALGRGLPMRRREFILGGAAAAWPLTTSAQRFERIRRIGILWPYTETDPDSQARIASLRQALMDLGWIEGRNLQIEYRWGASADDDGRIQRYAMELVALAPDIIVAGSGGIAIALKRTSRTVPIVFPTANDPVGTGLVESLERPGGNTTGLTGFESAPTDKFLELLQQIAPGLKRVGVIRNPNRSGGNASLTAIRAAAPLGVEVSAIDLRYVDAIERGIATFALGSNGGLIVPPAALATTHREVIINLAARFRLPAVYPLRIFVTDGGLLSYGPATTDLYPRVAIYIDRILKGAKPGDLPVQFPTRYELFVNLKTARALALDVPATLLAMADEVIN